MRIESVQFETSGTSTIVVTGGFSFLLPLSRLPELLVSLPKVFLKGAGWGGDEGEGGDSGGRGPGPGPRKTGDAENAAFFAKKALQELASSGLEFEGEDDFYGALKTIDEEYRAEKKALELCARAEQSSQGLLNKLLAKGFSRKAARAAVGKLMESGIVDDARYACAWARSRAERRAAGPALLAAELRSRGQGEDIVRAALQSVDFDDVLARAAKKELARILKSRQKGTVRSRSPGSAYGTSFRAVGLEISSGRPLADADTTGDNRNSPTPDGRVARTLYLSLKRQGFDSEKIRDEIEKLTDPARE